MYSTSRRYMSGWGYHCVYSWQFDRLSTRSPANSRTSKSQLNFKPTLPFWVRGRTGRLKYMRRNNGHGVPLPQIRRRGNGVCVHGSSESSSRIWSYLSHKCRGEWSILSSMVTLFHRCITILGSLWWLDMSTVVLQRPTVAVLFFQAKQFLVDDKVGTEKRITGVCFLSSVNVL